jgi:hypothetical protein
VAQLEHGTFEAHLHSLRGTLEADPTLRSDL